MFYFYHKTELIRVYEDFNRGMEVLSEQPGEWSAFFTKNAIHKGEYRLVLM